MLLMNASAACLAGSSLPRRTILSIFLTGTRTGFTGFVAGLLRPKLVPNLAAIFHNVARAVSFICSAHRGHIVPRTPSRRAEFDPDCRREAFSSAPAPRYRSIVPNTRSQHLVVTP